MTGDALWTEMTINPLVALGRLLLAAVFGALIGYERELSDRAAGLRTHTLISMAAAAFTLIMLELYANVRFEDGANADPIRIIEAVTAGVAFLAAGAIFRGEQSIRGLTTGAGMWAAGAVGVAAGVGYLLLGLVMSLLVFIVLRSLMWFEGRSRGKGSPDAGEEAPGEMAQGATRQE